VDNTGGVRPPELVGTVAHLPLKGEHLRACVHRSPMYVENLTVVLAHDEETSSARVTKTTITTTLRHNIIATIKILTTVTKIKATVGK